MNYLDFSSSVDDRSTPVTSLHQCRAHFVRKSCDWLGGYHSGSFSSLHNEWWMISPRFHFRIMIPINSFPCWGLEPVCRLTVARMFLSTWARPILTAMELKAWSKPIGCGIPDLLTPSRAVRIYKLCTEYPPRHKFAQQYYITFYRFNIKINIYI